MKVKFRGPLEPKHTEAAEESRGGGNGIEFRLLPAAPARIHHGELRVSLSQTHTCACTYIGTYILICGTPIHTHIEPKCTNMHLGHMDTNANPCECTRE